MRNQAEAELRIFRHFVEVARLPVVAESVEQREPPEPDVLCRFEDGEQVAFELVEVCNPANARFIRSACRVHRLIMSTYEGLPRRLRNAFDERFVDVPLSFSFRPEASLAAIGNVLPSLLTELVSVPERDTEYIHFSPVVAGAVVKVRRGGKLNDHGKVNFNLGGHFDASVSFDAVAAKLSKPYQASCAIELLAHFGGFAWGNDRSYRESLMKLVDQNRLGPFRRIWVIDWHGIGFVIPDFPASDRPPNKALQPTSRDTQLAMLPQAPLGACG